MLTPVLCYYMTSFNYSDKKAMDADFTCRYHLSNFSPDSIFYDSMGWGMTPFFFLFFFFYLGVAIAVFLSIQEMDSVLSL